MPGVHEAVQQAPGRHGVADPQPREERLVQGADVDHPSGVIQALQRRQRPAAEPQLRIVVVLDDPGPGLSRPGQQFAAPAHRKHRAGRILVRGGHHRRSRPGRAADPFRHHQALLVHRDGRGAQAGGPQALAGHRIAGVLDPDLVARRQQQAHRQVEGVLGAGGDQHLAGVALQPPRAAKIVGQRRPQLGQAARIGIAEVDGREAPHRTVGQPAPDLQAAGVHQAPAHGEGLLARLARQPQGREQLLRIGRVAGGGGGGFVRGRRWEGRGQVGADIGP